MESEPTANMYDSGRSGLGWVVHVLFSDGFSSVSTDTFEVSSSSSSSSRSDLIRRLGKSFKGFSSNSTYEINDDRCGFLNVFCFALPSLVFRFFVVFSAVSLAYFGDVALWCLSRFSVSDVDANSRTSPNPVVGTPHIRDVLDKGSCLDCSNSVGVFLFCTTLFLTMGDSRAKVLLEVWMWMWIKAILTLMSISDGSLTRPRRQLHDLILLHGK